MQTIRQCPTVNNSRQISSQILRSRIHKAKPANKWTCKTFFLICFRKILNQQMLYKTGNFSLPILSLTQLPTNIIQKLSKKSPVTIPLLPMPIHWWRRVKATLKCKMTNKLPRPLIKPWSNFYVITTDSSASQKTRQCNGSALLKMVLRWPCRTLWSVVCILERLWPAKTQPRVLLPSQLCLINWRRCYRSMVRKTQVDY